jgi:Ice-binding-like/Secretion system C-terminal sorting domain
MKKMFTKGLIALVVLLMPKSNFAQIIELGSSSNFALFTSAGEIKNVGVSKVYGNVGTHAGLITDFMPGQITGSIEVGSNATTLLSSTDLESAYTFFSTRTCQNVITATLGNGQQLLPSVYCIGSEIALEGDLVFDGDNDPNSIFIIKIDGALNVAANARILLTNDANYENVFWQVTGAVALGAGSEFKGNIVGNGAINMSDGASFMGRGLTKAGAINLNGNILNEPLVPLAIKLSKISVVNAGKINKLNWTSLSEGDGDFFELERSSNTRNFQKIATIQTIGSQKEYQYLDEYAPAGLNYYRLKMRELSGKFTYSQMVLANNKQNAELAMSVYPNPVRDFLNVKTTIQKGSNNSISIVDITGKRIENIALNENETQINMAKYSQGMYFVKYDNGGYLQTLKVIKQ